MRLRRLNMLRYGMFDGYSLDFGPSTSGNSDFHIVFGPNEAGKTTIFNGLLDCFFGIPNRTQYSFRHGSAMSVGAALEIDGNEQELIRIKKRSDSLLDDAGNPIGEEILEEATGRLSREAWTTMFSLNEVTLAAGAEDILAAKGELGPVIFQSAAGLPDLSRTLDAVLGHSEELFVPAARGRQRRTELRRLVEKVGEIELKLKEIDTNERVYKELRDSLDTARNREAEARSKHDCLNAKRSQLEKLKIAQTDVEELREKRRIARELARYPEAPPRAVDEAETLLSKFVKAENRKRDTVERLARLERQSERIATNPGILRFQERVTALTQAAAVSSRMRNDLLRRKETRDELRDKLRVSLDKIGKGLDEDPRKYVLDSAKIAELDAKAERFSSLQIKSDNARAELVKAERDARTHFDNTGNSDSINLAAEELEPIVSEMRAADLPAELKTAAANLENARSNVLEAVANLKPWNRKSIEILSHAPPTDNQAERWREKAKRLEDDIRSTNDNRRNNSREINILQSKIKHLTQLDGLVTDAQAKSIRHARDRAWQTLYERLDRKSADAFKEAMDEYDRVRDLRLEHSDRIADLHGAQMHLTEKESIRDSLDSDAKELGKEKRALLADTAPVLELLGLPGDFSPIDLPDWLKKRSRAEKSIVEFQKCERERDRIFAELEAKRAELMAALSKASITEFDSGTQFKRLLAVAADAASNAKSARVRLESKEKMRLAAKKNLEDRKSALASIARSLEEWRQDWITACKNSWLQGTHPETVKSMLDPLRTLRENLGNLDNMDLRIASMQREIDEFTGQVRELAGDLGRNSDADPFTLFDQMRDSVEEAVNAQREFEQNRIDREREKSEIKSADGELAKIEERVSELAGIFSDDEGVATASDLLRALRKCDQRSAILGEIGKLEHRLVNLLNAESADEAVAFVECQQEGLESKLLASKTEADSAGEEYVKQVRESTEAQNRINAVGSDEKAAKLTQYRQTLLLEIKEISEKALRTRLGVFAARRALSKYREAHRNEFLECATRFFYGMTLGNYTRLDVNGTGAEDTLIAKRSGDNRSCQVHELSKGTQFQLYLALRLAGFKRYCSGNRPLPFFADDIMASFDDERAKEAFRIMLEISQSSQMIYLTHHEHMLEIAERACGPQVRQHLLPVSNRAE